MYMKVLPKIEVKGLVYVCVYVCKKIMRSCNLEPSHILKHKHADHTVHCVGHDECRTHPSAQLWGSGSHRPSFIQFSTGKSENWGYSFCREQRQRWLLCADGDGAPGMRTPLADSDVSVLTCHSKTSVPLTTGALSLSWQNIWSHFVCGVIPLLYWEK